MLENCRKKCEMIKKISLQKNQFALKFGILLQICYIFSMDRESTQTQNQSNVGELEIMLPPEYKVKFYNDDYTTMEFVVAVLVSVFKKGRIEAEFLMRTVHEKGSAVVGVYPYDIAFTRAEIATKAARKAGFPLRITVER